ncbi:CAP domain-containing protein [Stutzerimonas zhaodongensis]|uniref:CAP domain-containing protein n=1 Tax=Stutzerimonas zhaodongensis TaxID=1176257 RepID=A0A3M2HXB8_9GAMM|nr:CAP domain-containing protein [Stutzerimonas zhaodongensis]MCQ4316698.1 CAP domain-containing protein [Stutzerimonas zhaodongensis]RMH92453.1 CAP domain-containing protein [Stutzerimonas zhaodongensis]
MNAFNPTHAAALTKSAQPLRLTTAALLAVTMTVTVQVKAQEPASLENLINEFRETSQACGNGEASSVGPLAPNDALALPPATSGQQLQEALQSSGYRPAKLQAISVSGPGNAQSAMQALKQRYCEPLRSHEYAEIGVSRDGNTWQVLLAKPLLSPDLGDWQQVGRDILKRVNDVRAKPRTCGKESFGKAPALSWNAELGKTALAHSKDMADKDYFSHQGRDGSQVSDRASRAGYSWQRIGENIAAGQGSAEQVMAGWLASPGHCKNIMNPDFTEMGAAYATNPQSAASSYWTQVFGTPR